MEKEVSHTIEIAVTLIVMSIVIGIILFTVTIGGGLRAESHEFATETKSTVEYAGLEELVSAEETVMPASTAYSLIRRYSNSISEYYCFRCNQVNYFTGYEGYTNLHTTDNICLATHLKGKVSLKVSKNGEGQYCVYVHSINCAVGKNTNCTCTDYKHEASCPYPEENNCTCMYAAHSPNCPCAHRWDCRTNGNGCAYTGNKDVMWGD